MLTISQGKQKRKKFKRKLFHKLSTDQTIKLVNYLGLRKAIDLRNSNYVIKHRQCGGLDFALQGPQSAQNTLLNVQ